MCGQIVAVVGGTPGVQRTAHLTQHGRQIGRLLPQEPVYRIARRHIRAAPTAATMARQIDLTRIAPEKERGWCVGT
jgi:hypothetical protein